MLFKASSCKKRGKIDFKDRKEHWNNMEVREHNGR